jgi:hypothetical protein
MIHSVSLRAIAVGLLLIATLGASAQTALKTIENPGGGRIVYGPVDGQLTEAGAIGAVLHILHGQYGDKPQVGKPFKVNGTDSVAVFFTLVKRTQRGQPIAGMVIAANSASQYVEAALLSDEASRFGATSNPMLKTLFGVWHPGAAPAVPPAAAAPAQALRPFSLADRSASVSLPADWKLEPNSGGGTIFASGPAGQAAVLNFPMLAMNSNDPRVQQTMRFAQGAGRNTLYARTLYYPYGGELGRTFVDLLTTMQRMSGQPVATVKIEHAGPLPGGANGRCARIEGISDPHDGKGPREFTNVFCSGSLDSSGSYMNLAYWTATPVKTAARDRATLSAILRSFEVDMNVVNRQAAAIAAPAIAQIHAIGRSAAERTATLHEGYDSYNQGVRDRWDSQERASQGFSNYLLDQSVIEDNERSGHATVWNDTAEGLVRTNPSRYSYVDTPNFWKGVDY